jgi:hypothetical protein
MHSGTLRMFLLSRLLVCFEGAEDVSQLGGGM